MAAGEESRKLLCECGKQHGTFVVAGLQLVCRHCDVPTIVPYTIGNLTEAIAFVEGRRRPRGGSGRGPRI